MTLEETTHIGAPPDDVYQFFERMDDQLYKSWHPDHITFRWVEGEGPQTGNRAYFEERIAGQHKKMTARYLRVEPGRYIEFAPDSWFLRLLLPHISFTIEPENGGCRVTQRIKVRIGPIGARLNQGQFDAARTHMKEEGDNLKRIVEQVEEVTR